MLFQVPTQSCRSYHPFFGETDKVLTSQRPSPEIIIPVYKHRHSQELYIAVPYKQKFLNVVSKKPVLRIHDILGWIRIRIRGSMPLTNESRSGSGSWIQILLFSSLTFKMPAKN
jgi:hypothetical protein